MSEASAPITVESPPPADRPLVREDSDAHSRLRQLARDLSQTRDRRRLVEFLRLRRSLR